MKNILLIVVDTLRPDHLGCYGYRRPTSPVLDRLAGMGTRLDALWSVSNFTAPAFTSLFTGLHPHHHGVFNFTSQAVSSPIWDLVREAGMRTGGVVTFRFFRNLLRHIWGPIEAVTDTRGFDFSKNLPLDVTASSLEWLADQGKDKGPFCLFVHYDGPHSPFRLPDRFAAGFDSVAPEAVDLQVRRLLLPEAEKLDRRRNKTSMFKFIKDVNRGRRKLDPVTLQWIIDKYDAAVHYNDHAIGKLLDGLGELGLADDTIIAVLSDHGDEFLEHGGFSHGGIHLYEEIVRTVGLIFDPGSPGHGRHLGQPVSQVEMLPALLRMAGVENAPSTGLGSLLENGSAPVSPVFCHGKSKLAMREGDHKLIVPLPNPSLDVITRGKMWINMFLQRELQTEIFDLARDPGETRNLASDKALRRRMQIRLRAHLAAPPPGPLGGDNLSADERERIEQEMKDLGYM